MPDSGCDSPRLGDSGGGGGGLAIQRTAGDSATSACARALDGELQLPGVDRFLDLLRARNCASFMNFTGPVMPPRYSVREVITAWTTASTSGPPKLCSISVTADT